MSIGMNDRLASVLLSALVASLLFACASVTPPHKWSAESVEQAVEIRGRELERSCEATKCSLNYNVKGERYAVSLDQKCTIGAKICIWRDGLIELYIPDSAVPEWRYGRSIYKSTTLSGDKRFIEQFKNGRFYAAYVVIQSGQRVNYVIQEDEICIDAPDGNQLCFNSYPGGHLAFDVRL